MMEKRDFLYAGLLIISCFGCSAWAQDPLAQKEAKVETQRCTDELCPCSDSCRCADACRCRSTGCRGCCQLNLDDAEVNKSASVTCVAQLCDCETGCSSAEACCE